MLVLSSYPLLIHKVIHMYTCSPLNFDIFYP
nr:MAG TPA: hypothetical protein [Caudoviricetes sp.]